MSEVLAYIEEEVIKLFLHSSNPNKRFNMINFNCQLKFGQEVVLLKREN